jgi:deoxycytidylate deaminase
LAGAVPLLTAARFGISPEGSDDYTTLAPCFGCMKELLQAKVRSVYDSGDFKVDAEHRDQLDALIARLRNQKGRVKKLVAPGVDPNSAVPAPRRSRTRGTMPPA